MSEPSIGSSLPPLATTNKPKSRRLALVVGVNHSTVSQSEVGVPLQAAQRDAGSISASLREFGEFELVSQSPLLGAAAKSVTIREAILDLADNEEDTDFLLFYFSGHGKIIKSADGRNDLYLVTHDFDEEKARKSGNDRYISVRWLQEKLFEREAGMVLVILDCCYGGNAPALGEKDQFIIDVRHLIQDAAKNYKQSNSGHKDYFRMYLTAGGYNEKVSETDGHGLFSGLMLRALRGEIPEVTDDAGQVEFNRLTTYLRDQLPLQPSDKYGQDPGKRKCILVRHKGLTKTARMQQEQASQQQDRRSAAKVRLELLLQKPYNDNFRQSRLESFVGRATELTEIKTLITEKQKIGGYLTITGQAGQGKSSIIAKIVEERGPDQTAHHFIPFAPPLQYQIEILSSLIATLLIKHDLLDLADAYLPVNAILPTLRNTFPELLRKLATLPQLQQEVIFIDGLDQIKPDATSGERDLDFLPLELPPGMVIVIGTRPDDTLKPLQLRHEINQYRLKPLSLKDFKLLLARQPTIKLLIYQIEELYNALHGNAFDLGFVATILQEVDIKDVNEIIERVKHNPTHLFDLTVEGWRKRSEWRTTVKSILGCLLASTYGQALTAEELGEITNLDTEQVGQALLILRGVIGELDQSGQAVYYLYHLKLIEYLQDGILPVEKRVFGAKEIAGLHLKIAQWCEKGGLATIGQDVKGKGDITEQRRRNYACQHYIIHLFHAKAYARLWQVLDEGQYGKTKIRFDPSTRSYAQDLNLGRAAAAREDLDFEESLKLLPKLWRYTLLRCSLASRADNYPETLFEAMVLLNREQEAIGLIELLTDPAKKIVGLARVVTTMSKVAEPTATTKALLARAYELTRQLNEADKIRVLPELIKATDVRDELVVTQLSIIVFNIKDSSARARALGEIAAAQAQAGQLDAATATLEQALLAATSIEDSSARASALSEIAAAQAQAGQPDPATATLEQALVTANLIEDSFARAWALCGIAAAQAQAGQSDQALVTANLIEDSSARARALREIAAAQAQAGQPDPATATLEQALLAATSIEDSSARARALGGIAAAQAQAGQLDAALVTANLIEDSYYRARALRGITATQFNNKEFIQMLSMTHKAWLQAKTRQEALALLPIATGLFGLSAELGTELCQAFEWVDDFLRDCS